MLRIIKHVVAVLPQGGAYWREEVGDPWNFLKCLFIHHLLSRLIASRQLLSFSVTMSFTCVRNHVAMQNFLLFKLTFSYYFKNFSVNLIFKSFILQKKENLNSPPPPSQIEILIKL